jgi:hypothetical protein
MKLKLINNNFYNFFRNFCFIFYEHKYKIYRKKIGKEEIIF